MPVIGSAVAAAVGIGSAVASGVMTSESDRARSRQMEEQAKANRLQDQQKAVENKSQIVDLQQQEAKEIERYEAGHGSQLASIGASGGSSSGFNAIIENSRASFFNEISTFNTKNELLKQSSRLQQEIANLSYRDQLSASQSAANNAALNGTLSSLDGVAQIGLNYPWAKGTTRGVNSFFEEELKGRSSSSEYGY